MSVWDRIQAINNPCQEVEQILKLIKTEMDYNMFCESLKQCGQSGVVKILRNVNNNNDMIGDKCDTVSAGNICGELRAHTVSIIPSEVARSKENNIKHVSRNSFKEFTPHKRKDVVRIVIFPSELCATSDTSDIWNSILVNIGNTCEEYDKDEIKTQHMASKCKDKVIKEISSSFLISLLGKNVQVWVTFSCLTFYVPLPDMTTVEELHHLFQSAIINDIITTTLVTDFIKQKHGINMISLKAQFPDLDYLKCWKYHAQMMLKSTSPKNSVVNSHKLESFSVNTSVKHTLSVRLKISEMINKETVSDDTFQSIKASVYDDMSRRIKIELTLCGEMQEHPFMVSITSGGCSIEDVTKGSVLLHLNVSSLTSLENIKRLVDSKELDSLAISLLSEELIQKLNIDSISFEVSMDETQFLQYWKELFVREYLEIHASMFSFQGSFVNVLPKHNKTLHVNQGFPTLVQIATKTIQHYLITKPSILSQVRRNRSSRPKKSRSQVYRNESAQSWARVAENIVQEQSWHMDIKQKSKKKRKWYNKLKGHFNKDECNTWDPQVSSHPWKRGNMKNISIRPVLHIPDKTENKWRRKLSFRSASRDDNFQQRDLQTRRHTECDFRLSSNLQTSVYYRHSSILESDSDQDHSDLRSPDCFLPSMDNIPSLFHERSTEYDSQYVKRKSSIELSQLDLVREETGKGRITGRSTSESGIHEDDTKTRCTLDSKMGVSTQAIKRSTVESGLGDIDKRHTTGSETDIQNRDLASQYSSYAKADFNLDQ